jgi:signal transduction histidine kinase
MLSSKRAVTNGEGKPDGAFSPRESVSAAALAGIGCALLALTAVAAVGAHRAHGRAFAGLFTDPHGSFSAIAWPTWGWGRQKPPLRFPDRIVAVDGVPLPPPASRFDLPGLRLAARIAALHDDGQRAVQLTFAAEAGPVVLSRPLRTLGSDEQLFFFWLYLLVGVFVLWSGAAVLILARRRAGARAYGAWTVGAFIFLLTFYDYHTTAWLAPLFSLSTVWVSIGVLWLAYSFPEPPRRRRRALLRIMIATTALAAAAAAVLMVGPYLGWDLTRLRMLVSWTAPLTLLALTISIIARLRTGSTSRRQELRSAVWGVLVVPAALAVGFALTTLTGTPIVHLLLPFLAPLMPFSIGYALIRNNILGTTALLTPRLFVMPALSGAGVVALLVGLALEGFLQSGRAGTFVSLVPWAASVATLSLVGVTGYRLSGRVFFAATARFRPTLQQLADDLASQRDVAAISRAIEGAVMRWLPTESARVVLPADLHHIANRPPRYRSRLVAGEAIWTTEGHWRRQLLVPMRSQGELRGVLVLAPKHQHALYTREDLELLDTIASLGAVALHNADAIAELETLRRFEVEAARDDKRLALGLVGAEISHEIAYPLNFLRYLFTQGDAGKPLDTRDLEIGREEVGRLERMFASLRKLRIPAPRPSPVLVLPRVRRALDLIRELLQDKHIDVTVEIPPDLTVIAEPDPLVQIFANLLRNAVQAVPEGGAVGVRVRAEPDAPLALEVWDGGPGISEELASTIFAPFVSTKEGSAGLGLAVTHRLVRSFGWTISARRVEDRTVFRIDVPVAAAGAATVTGAAAADDIELAKEEHA